MYGEFYGILILLIFSIILSAIISGASYILGEKQPDREKVSAYECGFDPFGTPGRPFSIRFFLIGILFLIFDLEISFLFPWCIVYNQIFPLGYGTMVVFLTILTLGLAYEWYLTGLS